MRKLVKFLEFLKEHKRINEGGGAGITFECSISASGDYRITKDSIEVISTSAEAGDTFNAHGYDDGMSDVLTKKVLEIDDSGLKNPSRDLLDLELSFDYTGDLVKFLHDLGIRPEESELDFEFDSDEDAEIFLSGKLSKKVDVLTFEDIFELKPDAEFTMQISISGNYADMHFGGWMRGEFEVGDTIMGEDKDGFDIEVSVNDEYTVWLKNDFDLKSYIPELKANESFLHFYKDVFSMDSDDIKLNAIQSKDFAVVVDGKIVELVDDEEEGQEYLDDNGYDNEVDDIKIIPTSEITDADEYEYDLTDSDWHWHYDDLKMAWQEDI